MLEALGLILVFAVILFLSYYTTRLIGKKFSGKTKNKRMRVVETLTLGIDKCLYLILIGKKHFLFISGKKGLELVSEIEMEEQIEDLEEETAGVFEFKNIFDTYSGLGNRSKKEYGPKQKEKSDELSGTGILGSIKKLKRINSNNR